MELLLIRHGLTSPARTRPRASPIRSSPAGSPRPSTSPTTWRRAIDAVYTSPLRRDRETAEPIARAASTDHAVVDDVAEWDRNSSEYVPIEELKATDDPRWQAMVRGEWPPTTRRRRSSGPGRRRRRAPHRRPPGPAHRRRLPRRRDQRLPRPRARPARAAGLLLPQLHQHPPSRRGREGHAQVVTVNETSHLRGTGLPMGLLQRHDVTARRPHRVPRRVAVAVACATTAADRLSPPASSRSISPRRGTTCRQGVSSHAARRSSRGTGGTATDVAAAHRRRPHRLPVPAGQAAPRHRRARLEAARRRGVRRGAVELVARSRSRYRRAGRAHRRRDADVVVDDAICRVPQLAIHLDRDVNERGLMLDKQQHLTPVWGIGRAPGRVRRLARRPVGSRRGRHRRWELCLFDRTPRDPRRRRIVARRRPSRQPGVVLGGSTRSSR